MTSSPRLETGHEGRTRPLPLGGREQPSAGGYGAGMEFCQELEEGGEGS